MKRDLALVRKILETIEGYEDQHISCGVLHELMNVKIEETAKVGGHLRLLQDTDLVEIRRIPVKGQDYSYDEQYALTWDGYDYLDELRAEAPAVTEKKPVDEMEGFLPHEWELSRCEWCGVIQTAENRSDVCMERNKNEG